MDLGRSSVKLFVSKSGRALLMFGAITFFARQLDSTELGVFFLFFAVQGLLGIPADLGIRSALEKRLSEGEDPETTLGSALAFKLVALSIVSLGVLAARAPLNAYLGADLAELLVVALVLREVSLLYIHAVRGELRVGETAVIELGRRLTWVVLGGLLVSQGYGAEGIVYGLICGSTVQLLWAHHRCNIALGTPSLDRIRSLFTFSKYDTITAVGGRVYEWMDTAIIGLLLAQRYVSAYELAWQVSLLVLLFSKSISLALFPQISQWNEQSSIREIESSISTALGFAVFVSLPAIVGAAIYGADVLRYVFGPEYAFAAIVLVVLMVEKLFQSFNDIVGISVRAIDRPDLAAKATVVSVGLNLVLNPVLILSVGFVGAAIATTLSWVVNTVLHLHYLSRFLSVDLPYRLLGWYGVSSAVMAVGLVAAERAVPVTGLLVLLAHVALGVAIYGTLSFLIPEVREQIVLPVIRIVRPQNVQ